VFCGHACRDEKPSSAEELLSVAIGLGIADGVDEHPIRIPDNAARLLVTLNHELNGFTPKPGGELDIELPENLEAECIRHYGAETCEIQNPPPGDYIIGIKAVRGNPAYQLTAVAILE
jgi:hypothetical protein